MKITDPKGTAAAVADANELNEQLEAANVEREALASQKATLETAVNDLTEENTQLKDELQQAKDALTASELKASGNEQLANENVEKFEEKNQAYLTLEQNFNAKVQELEAATAEAERLKLQLESKEGELADVEALANQAAAEADEVTEQNELLAGHLKVKGATPEVTSGTTQPEKSADTEIVEKYKQLQKNVKNARNRTERIQYQRALTKMQNDPIQKEAIANYLNTEYSTSGVDVSSAIELSGDDEKVYNAYKELTKARAAIMGDRTKTLAERRQVQSDLQRKIKNMLNDPDQSAAIARCQKQLYN